MKPFSVHFPRRIVTTLVPGEVISCDALILPGGGDITPAFFGEKNKGSRTVDTELDILQFQALDIAIAAGIPVIGICKGMQVINVAFGGTITQDMPEDCLHSIPFRRCVSYDTIMVDDSRLFKYFPAKMRVNSAHHQRIGRLGQHLEDHPASALTMAAPKPWSMTSCRSLGCSGIRSVFRNRPD